jgi:hypothetical protein
MLADSASSNQCDCAGRAGCGRGDGGLRAGYDTVQTGENGFRSARLSRKSLSCRRAGSPAVILIALPGDRDLQRTRFQAAQRADRGTLGVALTQVEQGRVRPRDRARCKPSSSWSAPWSSPSRAECGEFTSRERHGGYGRGAGILNRSSRCLRPGPASDRSPPPPPPEPCPAAPPPGAGARTPPPPPATGTALPPLLLCSAGAAPELCRPRPAIVPIMS